MKYVAALSLALFCCSAAMFAETTLDPAGWMVREMDATTPSFPENDSLEGFEPYSGKSIPDSGLFAERKVVFARRVEIPRAGEGRSAAIMVGTSDYPCDIYLNRTLIGRIGHYGDYYNSSVYLANRFLIDAGLITGNDILVVVARPDYEKTMLPLVKVGDWHGFASEVFWRNLFNVGLIQASVAIACVLALFFLTLILMGSREMRYAWFVLTCVAFAMSYGNMAFYHDGRVMTFLDKLSHWGLPLTTYFLFCFALEISGIGKTRKTVRHALRAVLAAPVLVSCVRTLLGTDKESLYVPFAAFTTGMVLPVLLLATLALLAFSVIRTPRSDTIGAMAGFSAIVGTSVHDLVNNLSGNLPFAWLVPYGYLGFVLSVFFILALDQTATLRKARRQAMIMERQHETLANVIADLRQVSEGLVSSSARLAGTTDETLAAVERYGDENRSCMDAFARQAESVESQVGKISERLATTAARVPEAIARQTRSSKEVTDSLAELGSRVSGSLEAVEQSNGFVSALASDADSSRRVVETSREALSRVEETASRVKAALSSIADLSEQTNVLSINAAIESARYGNVGKGFAVIAQEIRKLATQSQTGVKESFAGVEEMGAAIAETIKTHDAVRRALEAIIEKSHQAARQSAAITALVHEEEAESLRMGESARRMIGETDVLERLSREERVMNEESERALSEIARDFGKIRESLEAQGAMKDALFAAVDRMREIMKVNAENIDKLKTSIGRAQEAEELR